MIVEILHINGDEEDIYSRYHDTRSYQQFISRLKNIIRRAYEADATIIYRPNLGDKPINEVEYWFTPTSESIRRFPELRERFPLLDGMEGIVFTLLPDGIYAPSYIEEIDDIIRNDDSRRVIVGGKYKQTCVASEVRNLRARHPQIEIFIGDDISFENKFPPIKEYYSLPHTYLEDFLFKSSEAYDCVEHIGIKRLPLGILDTP